MRKYAERVARWASQQPRNLQLNMLLHGACGACTWALCCAWLTVCAGYEQAPAAMSLAHKLSMVPWGCRSGVEVPKVEVRPMRLAMLCLRETNLLLLQPGDASLHEPVLRTADIRLDPRASCECQGPALYWMLA